MIRLADQPALVAFLGADSRTLAESNFSRRLLADQWRQVLEVTASRVDRRRCRVLLKQFYIFIKDFADRVASFLALLLLAPLLVVVALLVRWRLGSPFCFVNSALATSKRLLVDQIPHHE